MEFSLCLVLNGRYYVALACISNGFMKLQILLMVLFYTQPNLFIKKSKFVTSFYFYSKKMGLISM